MGEHEVLNSVGETRGGETIQTFLHVSMLRSPSVSKMRIPLNDMHRA